MRVSISVILIQFLDCTANDGLLLWCQRSTEPYPDVNIKNFNTSWKDGKAFCAIIDRYRHDLLNYDDVAKASPKDALTKAFDVAEESLNIPKMLDVNGLTLFYVVSYKTSSRYD